MTETMLPLHRRPPKVHKLAAALKAGGLWQPLDAMHQKMSRSDTLGRRRGITLAAFRR
jgi:hypothetical protein